ncbi:hypothetical protein ABC977_17570 [Thioalkalicoccus limnaeus]|uniref:Uncharacterized protein n=1 Tax=Thioalkalicoccus limnaeus TaxID=120681 RepID=A0ABV4BJR5_9GAMM
MSWRNLMPEAYSHNSHNSQNRDCANTANSANQVFPDGTDTTGRRLWLVTLPSGERISVSYTPPASLAEVRGLWPDAQAIEPGAEPLPDGTLAAGDEALVRGWLAQIGEHDEATTAEVLARAASDPEALAFYLERAAAAGIEAQPETAQKPARQAAVCATCAHFERDSTNPTGGLGGCRIDAPASRKPGSCWPWPNHSLNCDQFEGDR